MRLNNLQIRNAKPAPKPYTLSDGLGLSLLVEPNDSKSWRFRYRFAG
ncbi:integrase arm-type DNA-binding domain-containing protein, partial [Serratia marcescens]